MGRPEARGDAEGRVREDGGLHGSGLLGRGEDRADLLRPLVDGGGAPPSQGRLVDAGDADLPPPRRADPGARLPVRVGLLFYRWVQRRVEAAMDARLPIEALAARLDRIQVVAMARPGSRKVKLVLQKLDREQSAVVKALGLTRFVPN